MIFKDKFGLYMYIYMYIYIYHSDKQKKYFSVYCDTLRYQYDIMKVCLINP